MLFRSAAQQGDVSHRPSFLIRSVSFLLAYLADLPFHKLHQGFSVDFHLESDPAGGYDQRILVEHGLVEYRRKGLLHSDRTAASPDIAGQGEQVVDGNQRDAFLVKIRRGFLEVDFILRIDDQDIMGLR